MGLRRKKSAVFLDRDGVINRAVVRDGKPYAPRRLEEFRLLPGVADAVKALRRAGYRIVVVTNQPDVGHGLIDLAVVNAMHERLRARLSVDAIEMCPHRQDEGCPCRKPKPGLLTSAARRLLLDLRRSFMVGDRRNDIAAGQQAGCCTVFVDRGYGEAKPHDADAVVRSLPEAARWILAARAARSWEGK